MLEQLTRERVCRPDQPARVSAAQIGRAALAGELPPPVPSVPPTAGQRIVIEPNPPRVRFEPLAGPEPDWNGWDQKLADQFERRRWPATLFELETDLDRVGWSPVSPNSLPLQLVAACQRGQVRQPAWGVYGPASRDFWVQADESPPEPETALACILDILAWARGALSLSSLTNSLNHDSPRPYTPSRVEYHVKRLHQSGRLYKQGPRIYALAEYAVEGIWLSKRGLVDAVVDQLLVHQRGGVHALQVQRLARRVIWSLVERVDESVLDRLKIDLANVNAYLYEMCHCRQLKRIDSQIYIRPDCDPDQVRLPNLVRPEPDRRSRPKPETARPKPVAADLGQLIINTPEATKPQTAPVVEKPPTQPGAEVDEPDPAKDQQEAEEAAGPPPAADPEPAEEIEAERQPEARTAATLGRRIMRVAKQLDDERLFDDDFLLDILFEEVSLDGGRPPNRAYFDELALPMVERHRDFRRNSPNGDEGE